MPNILKQLTNPAIKQLLRILTDRHREQLGFSQANYDELMLVKEEIQRRIDATINPLDNIITNPHSYGSN